jgi:D-glycero-D-manno-heptose 1,7-bisphosphate phosphatase
LPGLRHPGAAFLDRDGTINTKPAEGDYVKRPDELELLSGAPEAIRRLNDAGLRVIVVSNQRGVALGRMTEQDVERVNQELARRLDAAAGAQIDAFFYCPHDTGTCDCRKPDTGLFTQAHQRFPWIEFARSAMVGDSDSDVLAGRRLGMATVRLGVDAPDLRGAVDQLLRCESARS